MFCPLYLGGHRPVGAQVSVVALLPTPDGPQGSLHAPGPGAQSGPRLAAQAHHHHRGQATAARPRKRLRIPDHDRLLAPPRPSIIVRPTVTKTANRAAG